MKLTQYITILACALMALIGMSSCLGSNDAETVTTSYDNALITSFSLVDNTNVATGLASYVFTIDHFGLSDDSIHSIFPNDGIIFNPDSLPVGTIADSVKVALSYASPQSVYFKLFSSDGTLGQYSNFSSDSALYFASYPDSRLTVASYGGTLKTYHVKINVHQVEGDTIVWHFYTNPVWPESNVTDQRVDTIGRTLYWFAESQGADYLRTSPIGIGLDGWQAQGQVSFADPAQADLLDLGTLYGWHSRLWSIGKERKELLTSADGKTWSVASSGYQFVAILGNQPKTKDVYGVWNEDMLNAVVKVGEEYKFAYSVDAKNWTMAQTVPPTFPLTGFSRPLYANARADYGNLTSRLYITGGRTVTGELTSSTWSCDGLNESIGGPNWVEFAHPNDLPAMEGVTIIEYTIDSDNPKSFWLLQPGTCDDGKAPVNRLYSRDMMTLYYSEDYGVSWHRLSRYYTQYADNSNIGLLACNSGFYNPRDYKIYFFGGRYPDAQYCDTRIWGGVLNSLNFWKKR